MSHRDRHVPADRLTALALAPSAQSSSDDQAALRHLRSCRTCSQALARLSRELDGWRMEASREADAHFDEGTLESQRFRILDRLAHLGQAARVLPFPGPSFARTAQAGLVSRRWISAAAAAGLLIGIVTGQVLHVVPVNRTQFAQPEAAQASARPPGAAIAQASAALPLTDDELLDEIDRAVQDRLRPQELRALDALTPTITEIR
jgi:hypothetical protein